MVNASEGAPYGPLLSSEPTKKLGLPGGGGVCPSSVTRQKTVANHVCRVWWRKEPDDRRVGITGQSLRAIQRIRAYTYKCATLLRTRAC